MLSQVWVTLSRGGDTGPWPLHYIRRSVCCVRAGPSPQQNWSPQQQHCFSGPGPGGGEKRRKTAMYLGLIGGQGCSPGRGSARTGQLYTPPYFPPILATQELTTTPNWSTKTNLGFESPPSCAPPPKPKHNFLPIFLFLKTLLAI